jgi:hypothetical protein
VGRTGSGNFSEFSSKMFPARFSGTTTADPTEDEDTFSTRIIKTGTVLFLALDVTRQGMRDSVR